MKHSAILLIVRSFIIGKTHHQTFRTLTTIFAIGIGIATVLLVVNVTNGMITGIVEKFIETGTYHIAAKAKQQISSERLSVLSDEIGAHPQVLHANPEIRGVGILWGDSARKGVAIRALPPDIWETDVGFSKNISFIDGGHAITLSTILISESLALELNINVGDTIQLVTLKELNNRQIPSISSFDVGGIFNSGYRALDRDWVIIPYQSASTVFDQQNSSSTIGIKISRPFSLPNPLMFERNAESLAPLIETMESILHNNFFVQTWYQQEAARFLNFRATKNILLLIIVIVICISLSHIISSLSAITLDKITELAIVKAIGIEVHALYWVYLICGFAIGFGGAIIGLLIGFILTINVNHIFSLINKASSLIQQYLPNSIVLSIADTQNEYYLAEIPLVIRVTDMYIIIGMAILCSVFFSIVPAIRATRITVLGVLQNR